jgi:integrase
MPANYEMTWDGKARRWQKMYRGVLYKISCRQLNAPETKEGSYQAANVWWHQKLSDLTAEPKRREEINARLEQQHQWVLSSNKQAREITRELIERQRAVLAKPPEEITTDDLATLVIDLPGATSTPTNDTVGYHVARYLKGEQARVNANTLSMHEYDSARLNLEYFRDKFMGADTSVKTINPDKWEDYWTHLTGLDCSPETKKKRFRFARGFITWLASKGVMNLPANINLRRYKFGSSAKTIPTMTIEEVRTLVNASTGQLTLHLLLMANCGFTQQDVSDLKQSEVNWKSGTITRKRSKTDEHENVPTVTYTLWPRTFKLLKQYRSDSGVRVLLTKSGGAWMVKRLKNDKFNRTDNTKSVYRHLMKKTGIVKPPKLLRKTSATLIESNEAYASMKELFLGEAPSSITDRHYAAPSQVRFDRAVAWLGKQYGKTITG